MNPQVSIIRCPDYQPDQVDQAVGKAIAALGGINVYVRPKSKVLVKPNLLMAKEPEFGITTHPEVVRAVIRRLKEIECKIFVGDGPSVWGNQIENVGQVYRVTGLTRVCQEEGVELVTFDNKRWHGKFPLTTWIDECDALVNIPKFKTHEFTILTAAIKNLYGLIWHTFKTEVHKNYPEGNRFSDIVLDVYQIAKPVLTIVDGIVAMEGDGPATSGTLRKTGLIVAGQDCVAIDTVLAAIMGVNPLDIPTIRQALNRNLGTADLRAITIKGERLEDVITTPFKLPVASLIRKIPKPLMNIARKMIRYFPVVQDNKCIRCQACVKACPQKIISLKDKRIEIKYKTCIACFCCQEVCPVAAIKIKKSLLARMLGL